VAAKSYCFIDRVGEILKNESVTAFFTLKGDEEFLKDHFSGFPVMPGVLLLESLKQAAALLLTESGRGNRFYRLDAVNEVKFGHFIRPGDDLKIFTRRVKEEDSRIGFEGRIDWVDPASNGGSKRALAADFWLTPVAGKGGGFE
jgi:3-hydroxyacyl-[acyl-carrier-protein] dehydratase